VAAWAASRKLRFSPPKSYVLRLHRPPSDSSTLEDLPKLYLDGRELVWKTEFPYLGHLILESPPKHHSLPRKIPLDENKADKILNALYAMFRPTAKCQRKAPTVTRLGIPQVLHAKFLYPTPVLDADYQALDRHTYRCLRALLGQPLGTPSTLLARDMGIWNSRYLGHQRALRFYWQLRWSYWTRPIFEHALSLPLAHRPRWLIPGWVPGGVIARMHDILSTYKLSLDLLNTTACSLDWYKMVDEAIAAKFHAQCLKSAERHNHPLLGMPLQLPPPTDWDPNPNIGPFIAPYLRLNGEAACAGMRLRNTRLRLLPYDSKHHGTCRLCRTPNGETGTHLLQCPKLPESLRIKRFGLFQEVLYQINERELDYDSPVPEFLVNAVLTLDWPNCTEDLCRRVCHFVRTLIHTYAAWPEPDWENWRLRAYPVRRVRPMAFRRKQIAQEVIDVSDLRPLADSL